MIKDKQINVRLTTEEKVVFDELAKRYGGKTEFIKAMLQEKWREYTSKETTNETIDDGDPGAGSAQCCGDPRG